MKIAIIGSGISGLYAAWKLSPNHEVSIFEKNKYFGGHTDTHHVNFNGQTTAVDSGFIVFNHDNYPLFTEMLRQLGVESQASDMSFSVNNQVSGLEYNPSKKWSLLARPQNFLNKSFLIMLRDLQRFYSDNKNASVEGWSAGMTLEHYLDLHEYSDAFRREHLYPMCGALWSAPADQVGQIPIKFVVSFFQHHKMLQVKERPQWLTVKGGSATYIQAIRQQCPGLKWVNTEVKGVKRTAEHVAVEHQNGLELFDKVIMACHADQALRILNEPVPCEYDILSQFKFQPNRMVLHRDCSIMPKSRSLWASWHVHVAPDSQGQAHYGFSYWMNRLQNLACEEQVFATLNPPMKIIEDKILLERHYHHPVFDQDALKAQQRWHEINGIDRIYYAGAYWGWGFHEDGAYSAQRVIDAFNASV